MPIENKVDNFQFIVTEGTMNSLIGTVVINNFSENDVNNISKIQGTYTFSNIDFDGTTWTFGTLRSDNFDQYLDYNKFGNLRFYKLI
jgi:triacylglycerol esterase/lipase EstA (alpha/beta hydrolase family)